MANRTQTPVLPLLASTEPRRPTTAAQALASLAAGYFRVDDVASNSPVQDALCIVWIRELRPRCKGDMMAASVPLADTPPLPVDLRAITQPDFGKQLHAVAVDRDVPARRGRARRAAIALELRQAEAPHRQRVNLRHGAQHIAGLEGVSGWHVSERYGEGVRDEGLAEEEEEQGKDSEPAAHL